MSVKTKNSDRNHTFKVLKLSIKNVNEIQMALLLINC